MKKAISIFIAAASLVLNVFADSTKAEQKAEALYMLGISYGEKGQFIEAKKHFQQAHNLSPSWNEPIYQLAFTYLMLEDAKHALTYYKKVNKLQPDRYAMTDVAIWTLENSLAGKYPLNTYLKHVIIVDFLEGPEEKLQKINLILENNSTYTPALLELAKLQEKPEKGLKIIDQALELDADDFTKCELVINKALLYQRLGQKEEAIQLLEQYHLKDNVAPLYKAKIAANKAWIDGTIFKLTPELQNYSGAVKFAYVKLDDGSYGYHLQLDKNTT